MKTFLIYAFALLAITFPAMADEAKLVTMEKTHPTLVAFHADWCGKCKVLGPKMKEVMASLSKEDKDNLTVVKFNLSDEATKAEGEKLAAEHGLTDLFQYYAPKTGFAVLYKGDVSMAEQEKLMSDDSVESIQEKIEVYIHDQTNMNKEG